jgi:hypothetical protein
MGRSSARMHKLPKHNPGLPAGRPNHKVSLSGTASLWQSLAFVPNDRAACRLTWYPACEDAIGSFLTRWIRPLIFFCHGPLGCGQRGEVRLRLFGQSAALRERSFRVDLQIALSPPQS